MNKNKNQAKFSEKGRIEKDVTEIKGASDWLEEQSKSRKEKMKIEKADSDLLNIFHEAVSMIKQFLMKLNINIADLKIDSLQLYSTNEDSITQVGVYIVEQGRVIVNKKNITTKQKMLRVLVHEIYHALSINAITVVQHPNKDNGDILYHKKAKSGYSSKYSFIKKINTEHVIQDQGELFKAFNEGITDALTWLTLNKLKKENQGLGYPQEVLMIFEISKKVYGGGKSKTFLHNYFSGEMMHLRKIEKFYGKGSLMILALLNTKNYYKEEFKTDKKKLAQALKFREEAIEFFKTGDSVRRETLRRQILKVYS